MGGEGLVLRCASKIAHQRNAETLLLVQPGSGRMEPIRALKPRRVYFLNIPLTGQKRSSARCFAVRRKPDVRRCHRFTQRNLHRGTLGIVGTVGAAEEDRSALAKAP